MDKVEEIRDSVDAISDAPKRQRRRLPIALVVAGIAAAAAVLSRLTPVRDGMARLASRAGRGVESVRGIGEDEEPAVDIPEPAGDEAVAMMAGTTEPETAERETVQSGAGG